MKFERIYNDFMKLAQIGKNADGSVTRLLFDDNYRICAEETKKYMEEICIKHNFSFRHMPSGATHDGNSMAMRMPSE